MPGRTKCHSGQTTIKLVNKLCKQAGIIEPLLISFEQFSTSRPGDGKNTPSSLALNPIHLKQSLCMSEYDYDLLDMGVQLHMKTRIQRIERQGERVQLVTGSGVNLGFKGSGYLNPARSKIPADFSLPVSYRFGLKRLTARVNVSSVLVSEPSPSALPA